MHSALLPVSQREIQYEDEGTGPAIVLLHAFPLDARMWSEQARALSSGYRVIAPNLLGLSPAISAGQTIDSAAEMVAELLDQFGLNERVAVAGLSMGGYVALSFARQYPQRLRGLILADTKADPDDTAAREARNALIDIATTRGVSEVVDCLLPKLLSAEAIANQPEVVQRIRGIAASQSVRDIVAAIQALRDRPDATPGLKHISVPTLVIVGELDAVTPPELARMLAESIPDARLIELPRCGHLSNLEDNSGFTSAIRNFLDNLPIEPSGSRTV